MTRGFAGFGRYNDVLAMIIALMFVLMLLVRGVAPPVRFQMTGPTAGCAPSQCIEAERIA